MIHLIGFEFFSKPDSDAHLGAFWVQNGPGYMPRDVDEFLGTAACSSSKKRHWN
jgi:hypothetical protein